MNSLTIVPLREVDLLAAAEGLARAFQEDPLQSYVFPDPAERVARSPGHFAPLLRYGLQCGEALTTTRPSDGAAVWLGPNAWQITPERAAAAGLDDLPAIMGAAAAERFFSVLAAVDPYHHRDVPAAHWYVMVAGVSPEAQGTAQPKNVAFYERLGFRRVVDTVEPSSGLRMWTVRRDPLAPRTPGK